MKNLHRSLLAMAAIAAFTAPALADSQVQLFGIVDAGILSQSSRAPAAVRPVSRPADCARASGA
jgi:Skp family chaperone for outer membrane proteins